MHLRFVFDGRRGRMVIIKWNTHFMICLVLVGRRGRTAIIKWKCVFLNFMFLLAGVGQNASLSGTGKKQFFMFRKSLQSMGDHTGKAQNSTVCGIMLKVILEQDH